MVRQMAKEGVMGEIVDGQIARVSEAGKCIVKKTWIKAIWSVALEKNKREGEIDENYVN